MVSGSDREGRDRQAVDAVDVLLKRAEHEWKGGRENGILIYVSCKKCGAKQSSVVAGTEEEICDELLMTPP
jgi:hypothetical protein